jgi:hypothetical protein
VVWDGAVWDGGEDGVVGWDMVGLGGVGWGGVVRGGLGKPDGGFANPQQHRENDRRRVIPDTSFSSGSDICVVRWVFV